MFPSSPWSSLLDYEALLKLPVFIKFVCFDGQLRYLDKLEYFLSPTRILNLIIKSYLNTILVVHKCIPVCWVSVSRLLGKLGPSQTRKFSIMLHARKDQVGGRKWMSVAQLVFMPDHSLWWERDHGSVAEHLLYTQCHGLLWWWPEKCRLEMVWMEASLHSASLFCLIPNVAVLTQIAA